MRFTLISLGMIYCVLLGACTGIIFAPEDSMDKKDTLNFLPASPSPTPFQPQTATPGIVPTLETPLPKETSGDGISIWIHPGIPGKLNLPQVFSIQDRTENAKLILTVGEGSLISHWIYALVAPFPEVQDSLSHEDILDAWHGDGRKLLVSEGTRDVFQSLWGSPDPSRVVIVSSDNLLDEAWKERQVWVILPFEDLDPRWKVLEIDGQSPVHKEFDLETYPLNVPFVLQGERKLVEAVEASYGPQSDQPLMPSSNRDPNKLTTLVMTGVTALVRATAWTMENQGIKYPARDIGEWLREADITHISNEVPFARNCPYPNPVQQGVVFCSDGRYITLLEEVGTDIVELTGDHFHDWGPEAMYYTLDLYKERAWLTYGGGENYAAGRAAITLDHHGNRIAFIGCNRKGGGFARASATNPGSVACDFDWMKSEIERLSDEGYLVIATFQHFEYYSYVVPESMKSDFRELAKAGAIIVSGSQAHQPHGFEFYQGSFLHFGLGNLFFDQYTVSPSTRQAFVDRHIIYNGQHISTELLTMVFEDFARARPMNLKERRNLLEAVFTSSGW